MRLFFTTLFACVAAGSASAQSSQNWGGGYAGVALNAQSASDGDTTAIIDPGLDSRLTYLQRPPGRSVSADALESSAAPAAFVGWRRELAGWMMGVEGQVQIGGPEVSFDTGFGEPPFLDRATACGDASVGCLDQTSDSVAADIEIEQVVSLRVAAGRPIGDRILLSAYAGPAMAFGQLELLQTSDYGTSRFNSTCTRFCVNLPTGITETRGRTENDTALGVVAGVTVDLRITNRLSARADLGYHRFEALQGSVGGTTGGDSEVRAQSAGFSAGLGLSVQF